MSIEIKGSEGTVYEMRYVTVYGGICRFSDNFRDNLNDQPLGFDLIW